MDIEQIARVCHASNAEYCVTLGDNSQKPWDGAEQWQWDSAIAGVKYALANRNAPPSAQHEAWLADKKRDGWKYGPVKDPAAKTHPCFVPYAELPVEQRVKDYIFQAIVKAFVSAQGGEAAKV